MEDKDRYGKLLTGDMKLFRIEFRELVRLIGIHVLYRAPLPDKHWTTYNEIDSNYAPPILVGCIFHNHPTQQTLKKLGWISELQADSSLIEVDYDLPALQQGALFIIPSGLDNSVGRLFRVVKITNDIIYPSSLVCEIVPEYEDTFVPESSLDYTESDFTLLNAEEDRMLVG